MRSDLIIEVDMIGIHLLQLTDPVQDVAELIGDCGAFFVGHGDMRQTSDFAHGFFIDYFGHYFGHILVIAPHLYSIIEGVRTKSIGEMDTWKDVNF